jgi:hypothetical protein
MIRTTFDRRKFWTIIGLSMILNILWAIASTKIELLVGRDKGFVTGVGFLLLYSLPFFTVLPRNRQTISVAVGLTLVMFSIFCIASFVIPSLFINLSSGKYWDLIAAILSSLFSTFFVVKAVHRVHPIIFIKTTIVCTFILASSVTIIFILFPGFNFSENQTIPLISSLALGYMSWQLITTAAIGIGVSLHQPAANSVLAKAGVNTV